MTANSQIFCKFAEYYTNIHYTIQSMRKTLLTLSALMAAAVASAQEPRVFPQAIIMGLTPDNMNAISDYSGDMMFFDLESGENPKIFTQSADGLTRYSSGNGNFAGNGIIAGYRGPKLGSSVYIYGKSGIVNGRWITLPGGVSASDTGSANGVTADGTRICGNASTGIEFGPDAEGTMVLPCYWDREGNTINSMQRLPYPLMDYSNLKPMYVTALAISDDGHTIAGQQVSWSGRMREMLVYQQAEDGSWSYFRPFADLVNPNKVELPEFPGDGPAVPSQETYMTEEQIARFNAAFEAYQNSSNPNAQMPRYEQFMDRDSIIKYNEALVPYNAWIEKNVAWEEANEKILDESVSFEFNQVDLSPNGRYLGCTAKHSTFNADYTENVIYTPYLYDLVEKKTVVNSGPNIKVTSVSNEGDLLGNMTLGDVDFGYILPAGATEWIPIHEYIVSQHPELKEWIDENWRHDVWVETVDEDGEIDGHYEEMVISGLPLASRDFSYVMSNAYVFWNGAPAELANDYVAYLLPLKSNSENAITDIKAEDPANVQYYDLQGRRVQNPTRGLYISKGGKRLF